MCVYICVHGYKCVYTILFVVGVSHSMHRIFTATDFHHLSVQQHKSYLSDAFTTDFRCAKEAVL